ncbi:MAG: DUF2188 domain-containing protein [Bacteroidia bacterium]
MAKRTIRVYKNGNVWVAKKDGTSKASAIRNTQKEAYLAARNIALNQGLTITVYYPTGGIKSVINPQNKSEENNCFLTTSCVKYFGLPDDCYELQTLRKFRDNYLLKSSGGRELVQQYYSIAPSLVKKLERNFDRKNLFEEIFYEIKKACKAIENKEFERAKIIYEQAVSRLFNHFKTA